VAPGAQGLHAGDLASPLDHAVRAIRHGQDEPGRYALVTPDAAARDMVGWVRSAASVADTQSPAIDIYGHDGPGRLRHGRLWVRPAGGFFEIRRDGIMPGRLDEKRLCQILATMLTGAA
jgi:hypothetical protein